MTSSPSSVCRGSNEGEMLADTYHYASGGWRAERKLEIMKDTSDAQQLTADKIVNWAITKLSVYLRGDE